jgi:hypothetical protein
MEIPKNINVSPSKNEDGPVDPSKRKFLKTLFQAAAMGAAAELTAGKVLASKSDKHEKEDDMEKDVWQKLREIKDKYGIRVYFTPIDRIEMQKGKGGFELTLEAQIEVLGLIDYELGKYPPSLLSKSPLMNIRVVHSLRSDQEFTEGLSQYSAQTITLNYVSSEGMDQKWREIFKDSFLTAFHHEIFHQLIEKGKFEFEKYQDWPSLNPFGVKSYKNSFDWAGDEKLILKEGGFVNSYSLTDEMEDRAEIFAFLMTKYNLMLEKCTTDKFLEGKINYMKKILMEDSGGLMDGEYWNRIKHDIPIGEYYFQKKINGNKQDK